MPAKKREIPNWVLIVAAVGVLVLFVTSWRILPTVIPEAEKATDRAQVLSALFAALAFGGVIGAIIMQKRELELQREELEETREVLGRQSDALARQAETARVQLIEGTLFEMLRLHHEIVASARYHDRQGRMVFLVLARSVREHTESYARNATVEDAMRQGLNEFREQLQSFLPTYRGTFRRWWISWRRASLAMK